MFSSKQLLKNTSVYGAGLVIARMIGFLLIPIYTRLLTPTDYGILEILDLITFVLGVLISGGLHSATPRFYYSTKVESERRAFVSTGFFFVMSLTTIATLFVTIFARQVANVFFQNASYSGYVRLTAVTLLLATVVELAMSYLRTRQQPYRATGVALSRLLVNTLLAISLVVGFRYGVWGLLWANLVANFLLGGYCAFILLREVGVSFSWQKLSPMIVFGLPMALNSAGMFVISFSDRFFLQRHSTLAEVGVYGLAYKIGMLLNVMINLPFGQSWGPHVFEHADKPGTRLSIARATSHFALVIFGCGVLLVAATHTTIKVLTPAAYWGAIQLAPLIVFSYVADGFRGMFHTSLLAAHKPRVVGALSLSAAVINLGLNVWLITRWGAMGAAVATFITFLLFAIASYGFAQKYFYVPYEKGRIFKIAILFSIACVLILSITASSTLMTVLLHSSIVIAFCMAVWWSGAITIEERSSFKELLYARVLGKVMPRKVVGASANTAL